MLDMLSKGILIWNTRVDLCSPNSLLIETNLYIQLQEFVYCKNLMSQK